MKVISQPKQQFSVILVLTEQEAGALHDIVAYGYKPFMEVFKEKLGKSYIEQHEQGAKSLFETVAKEMPKHLGLFRESRKLFETSKYNWNKYTDSIEIRELNPERSVATGAQ